MKCRVLAQWAKTWLGSEHCGFVSQILASLEFRSRGTLYAIRVKKKIKVIT